MRALTVLALVCVVVVANAFPSKKSLAQQLQTRLAAPNKADILQKLRNALINTVEKKSFSSAKDEKMARSIAKLGASLTSKRGKNSGHSDQDKDEKLCDKEYRQRLALAAMGLTDFAGFIDSIVWGYFECAEANGNPDKPLFTHEEMEERYEEIFEKVVDAERPLLRAAEQKVELFQEGGERYQAGVAAGDVTEDCLNGNWLVQYGLKGAVVTMFVESIFTENFEVTIWVYESFPDIIEAADADGTLDSIFAWIYSKFGDEEQAEAGN